AWLSEPDGVIRLHRRPAPVGLPGRAIGQTFACEKWSRSCCASPGAGETGRMKAMILAAGLGTRLRPLTDDRPKALVHIAGHTPLEITIRRLREFGIRDLIINAHHLADNILEYLEAKKNFGIHIEVSREDVLLDTGGGLKKAAQFFLESQVRDEPFI